MTTRSQQACADRRSRAALTRDYERPIARQCCRRGRQITEKEMPRTGDVSSVPLGSSADVDDLDPVERGKRSWIDRSNTIERPVLGAPCGEQLCAAPADDSIDPDQRQLP